jgi:endonuclease/exonuclease/phosphatase family metal-dependent hydrolase
VRLATWNCQTGLDSNWPALERFEADVVTVQECGSETEAQAEQRKNWTCAWQAGRWHKGLAVLARAPYAVQEREPSQPFAVSTLISGPVLFRFVGFWAMSEKDVGLTYTRQATRVIEDLPEDGIPTVMAGDFNASKSPAHLRNVQRLASRGLVSAYHAHHGVEHRSTEEHPTSFHMWQQERPFHMDFVFVPREWRIDAVDVGFFEDYSFRGGSSDHVPVVVTIGRFG